MLMNKLRTESWPIRSARWRNRGIPRRGAEFRGLWVSPEISDLVIQVARDSQMAAYDNSFSCGGFGTSIAGNEVNTSLAGLKVAGFCPP